jgi:hypothetical protein
MENSGKVVRGMNDDTNADQRLLALDTGLDRSTIEVHEVYLCELFLQVLEIDIVAIASPENT